MRVSAPAVFHICRQKSCLNISRAVSLSLNLQFSPCAGLGRDTMTQNDRATLRKYKYYHTNIKQGFLLLMTLFFVAHLGVIMEAY